MNELLSVKNLHVSIKGKEILKGIDLSIKKGEIHALMGPNGSGKSTFANVLTGNPLFSIDKGSIVFKGKKINDLLPNERAKLGLFLAFQKPVEIEGVKFSSFLRESFNALGNKMPFLEFKKLLEAKSNEIALKKDFLSRSLNEGLSGGEKKKSELLQLKILKPELSILDEIDSGLDIDALKNVSFNLKNYQKETGNSLLLITHYKRILEFIKPDFVHILINGKIVLSSDSSLADKLEEKGYSWIIGQD